MKTVLMATSVDFWHNDRGDRSRIYKLYRYLTDAGFHVPVFYTGSFTENDEAKLRDELPDLKLYRPKSSDVAEDSPQPPTTRYRRTRVWLKESLPWWIVRPFQSVQAFVRRAIKGVQSPKEATLNRFVHPGATKEFAEMCQEIQPDAILIHYIHQAYLLDQVIQDETNLPRFILDTLDVMHARTTQFHNQGERHWANVSYEEEQEILQRFDLNLAIQESDADELRSMAPETPVLVAGHSLNAIHHESVPRDPVRVLYFGTGAMPNRHAIGNFLKYVWAKLPRDLAPRVELRIAGSICETLEKRRLPRNVRLLGYVNDVGQLYAESDIVVNPVEFGGGLKIKTVEALCHGLPLLTTTKGVEGLPISDSPPCIVCNTLPEMTSHIQALVENPDDCAALSQRASEYAQHQFSPKTAYGPLRDWLEALPDRN